MEGLVVGVAHQLQDTATTQDVVVAAASTPNGRNVKSASSMDIPPTASTPNRYDEDYVPEQRHTSAAATSSYTVDMN
jgi:hypothetical protein